jgi:hypothetical protein
MTKPSYKTQPGWMRRPDRPPRVKSEILIRDLAMRPLFVMTFWGLTRNDLCFVSMEKGAPSGGEIVAAALRRKGIDPDKVIFTLWDVR